MAILDSNTYRRVPLVEIVLAAIEAIAWTRCRARSWCGCRRIRWLWCCGSHSPWQILPPKENVEYCLIGNEAWRTLVRAYLEDIERNHPNETVTARIYNPCNLMMALYRLAKLGTGDALATAEIVVSSEEGGILRIVLGAMVWNGRRVSNIAEVLPADVPALSDLYFGSVLDGGPWAVEEHIAAQHGLSYVLVEGTPTHDGMISQQLVIEDGTLRRLQVNDQVLKDFGAFCEAHHDYLRAFVADFDSWAAFR